MNVSNLKTTELMACASVLMRDINAEPEVRFFERFDHLHGLILHLIDKEDGNSSYYKSDLNVLKASIDDAPCMRGSLFVKYCFLYTVNREYTKNVREYLKDKTVCKEYHGL